MNALLWQKPCLSECGVEWGECGVNVEWSEMCGVSGWGEWVYSMALFVFILGVAITSYCWRLCGGRELTASICWELSHVQHTILWQTQYCFPAVSLGYEERVNSLVYLETRRAQKCATKMWLWYVYSCRQISNKCVLFITVGITSKILLWFY